MPKSLPKKVVLDTSALISLAHGGVLGLVIKEFQVVISEQVRSELLETARFQDEDGKAAKQVLGLIGDLEVRPVEEDEAQVLVTSRIDRGEASCIFLAQEQDVQALISDDFRAMQQLQFHANAKGFELGFGAILIRALVLRGKLDSQEALRRIETIAHKRNWLGRPIYNAYHDLLQNG